MAHDVFIGYAAEDKPTADAVCGTLEAQRIRCWIAPRDVLPGVSYAEAIVDAINESRLMVLVFSSHSNSSPQVMREVERAASKGIPILPFRIEDVPLSKSMEFFLSAPHWLDALTPPLEKHLGHLAETVKLLLSRERPAEGPADEAVAAEGPYRPTPLRDAYDTARRWVSRPVVWLAAIAAVVAVGILLGLLVLLPSDGEEDDSGLAAFPPTPGGASPTVVTVQPTAVATPLPSPKLLWQFETGDWIFSSPAVVDGVVYIGSHDNYVYALDAATGEKRWRFQTGSIIESSPAVVDAVAYIGSDTYLYALDAATGEQVWRFQTGGLVWSSPAVADGVVYVGSQDTYVYALDAATGEERWRFKAMINVFSSPAVVDGVVYIGGDDSYVYALDAATGEKVWRFMTGGKVWSRPAVANGMVYVGSGDAHVYALDAATGEKVWRSGTGDWVYSSPAVADGVVYVGSHDNHIYALDAATGEERWRFQTGGNVWSSPAVADGVVYVGSGDTHVYALDAATGVQRWRFRTGVVVNSSPAVADGVAYVGSGDGYVYAITEQ